MGQVYPNDQGPEWLSIPQVTPRVTLSYIRLDDLQLTQTRLPTEKRTQKVTISNIVVPYSHDTEI